MNADRCAPARRRWTVAAAVAVTLSAVVVAGGRAPAGAATFSNTTSITLPAPACGSHPAAATPYPSNITVSGMSGTISDVNVTLSGINHPFQGDLEVLLVGPAGGAQNLVLLSDAGTGAFSNATVTFDDAAAAAPPQNTAWPAGTYKPVNYTELNAESFPSPAPTPSANATLAAFNGASPNGTWSLYVVDDACPDAGSIGGGWSLDITTVSAASTTTGVSSAPNPSRTGQAVTFTATVISGGNPVTTGTVTFTEGATVLAAGVALGAGGQAAFTTSSLAEGNHLVTATYNGTGSFATSSGSVDQRVDNNTVVSGETYCNPGAITLNDSAAATPYPSKVFVTGAPTAPNRVTLSLRNVTHPFAGDVEALLVGPGGQNLVVVSDAGTAAVGNVTVDFDDAAAAGLPATGSWAAVGSTITARPTDHAELVADSFPAPAPAPTGATTLSTFNGVDPNGTWSLFVKDDAAPDGGAIAGGWCLTLKFLATPTITTQASVGGPLGTSISDTAVLSGGASPTGTITFGAYGPDDTTCTGAVAFTSSVPVNGNGTYESGPFMPTAVGTYRWIAAYSGDGANNPVSGACNDPNESAVISAAVLDATLSTTATPTATVGQPISDTATVTGAPSGPVPTGTVTFRLYGPGDATCSQAPVFTSTQSLAGSPATAGSGPFTPMAPGTYRWVASYSGDGAYAATTAACNAANETTLVTKAAPVLTTQASPDNLLGAPVRDVATLSGGHGPTGSLTFRLHGPDDATCSPPTVFSAVVGVSGNGSYSSPDFTPTAPGTYRWVVDYSGDAANDPAGSPCNAPNETVTIRPFAPPSCSRTLGGDVLGPVTVDAGETVCIADARVVGTVTVNPGGGLTVAGSRLFGGVMATSPSFFSLCGSQVAAPTGNPGLGVVVSGAAVPLRIGDPAAGCAMNRVAGDVNLGGNTAGLVLGGNVVSRNVSVNGNGGGAVVKGNTISGALACSGNTPPPTYAGQPNSAASKSGQCAGL